MYFIKENMIKDKNKVSEIISCFHDGVFNSIVRKNNDIELLIDSKHNEDNEYHKIIFYDCSLFKLVFYEDDRNINSINNIKDIFKCLCDISRGEISEDWLSILVNTDPDECGSYSWRIRVDFKWFELFDYFWKNVSYQEINEINDKWFLA